MEQLNRMDYFDAYLRYWEHYYLSLALTGLSASRNLQVVAFSQSALQSTAQIYHDLYGSGLQASEFHTTDKGRRLHPEWLERAQPAIDRVEAGWKSVGGSLSHGRNQLVLVMCKILNAVFAQSPGTGRIRNLMALHREYGPAESASDS